MEVWQIVLTSGAAVALINGGLQLLLWKMNYKSNVNKGLMAMLEDRLLYLGEEYLEKQGVTTEQYKSYFTMYEAYKANGGNGTIERIKNEVDKLKLKTEK